MSDEKKETPEVFSYDKTLVANVVANCRQQIGKLKMNMPLNLALALQRADDDLAFCEQWIRVHNP